MSTINGTTELRPARRKAAGLQSSRNILECISGVAQTPGDYWANLCDLSDRELMDIGITRSEIDYIASHRGCDPRGFLSGE